jgi:hypothetical protein
MMMVKGQKFSESFLDNGVNTFSTQFCVENQFLKKKFEKNDF